MAKRGDMTLAFGPLKPVGLKDERTGVKPFAVVQLRQDDSDGTLPMPRSSVMAAWLWAFIRPG